VAQGLAFDLPGHGRSADWAGTDCTADCTAAALAPCYGPRAIVGHSFGATVALRLALKHPSLCHSLTLIEPVFFAVARANGAPGACRSRRGPDLYRHLGRQHPMGAAAGSSAASACQAHPTDPRRRAGIGQDSGGRLNPGVMAGGWPPPFT